MTGAARARTLPPRARLPWTRNITAATSQVGPGPGRRAGGAAGRRAGLAPGGGRQGGRPRRRSPRDRPDVGCEAALSAPRARKLAPGERTRGAPPRSPGGVGETGTAPGSASGCRVFPRSRARLRIPGAGCGWEPGCGALPGLSTRNTGFPGKGMF